TRVQASGFGEPCGLCILRRDAASDDMPRPAVAWSPNPRLQRELPRGPAGSILRGGTTPPAQFLRDISVERSRNAALPERFAYKSLTLPETAISRIPDPPCYLKAAAT